MVLFKTSEFINWYNEQPSKVQYIIEARLKRISEEGHWGFINKFDGLIELKWTSGIRIYKTFAQSIQRTCTDIAKDNT